MKAKTKWIVLGVTAAAAIGGYIWWRNRQAGASPAVLPTGTPSPVVRAPVLKAVTMKRAS